MPVYSGPALPPQFDPPPPLPESEPLALLLKALQDRGVNIHKRMERRESGPLNDGITRHQFVCSSIRDFPELADKILTIGKSIRFQGLPIPNRCISAQAHQHHEILARYVVDYYIQTDGLIGRWDVLVEAI